MAHKNRVCEICGSNKYYCKGMCKSCYRNQLVPSGWSKNFEFCTNCGSSEFPHVAKGLCRRCYATFPSQVLCVCGCGEYVSQVGNKTRKYVHGHRVKEQWKDPKYIKSRIGLFAGENNPQWGKFGKDHPSYKHKKTKKYREDASKRMLDRMASGERKTTNIEIILSNILDEMKIVHHSQFLMYDKFVVDEYLPDFNLVIEAYGGYWHGDSRKFPNPDKMQIRNQKRDSSRIKYLNKCGHTVIVLWENELTKNVEWCKTQIRYFIH